MSALSSSDLRDTVRIEKKTITGQAVSWSLRASVAAAIEPLSYAERMSTQQLTGTLNAAVRIRYLSTLAITDRIRFGTRTMNIVSYSTPPGPRVETRVITTEVLS